MYLSDEDKELLEQVTDDHPVEFHGYDHYSFDYLLEFQGKKYLLSFGGHKDNIYSYRLKKRMKFGKIRDKITFVEELEDE